MSSVSGLFGWVALFSVFANLLLLTGPLFMLQVYDRVLGSRSVETLAALFAIVTFLFVVMGVLEAVRSRILGRAAARVQHALDHRAFDAALRRASQQPQDPAASVALRDLESVQRAIASPAFASLFDLPFVPLFLAGLFIFHPLIGWFSVLGAVVLLILMLLNQRLSRGPVGLAQDHSRLSDRMSDQMKDMSEVIQALGMRQAVFSRWSASRSQSLGASLVAADVSGVFGTAIKTVRLFLQSAILALGAWLVLRQDLTPGAMIASSILMGRALAPVEVAVTSWPAIQRARDGWTRLSALLAAVPVAAARTPLPRPAARLSVSQLTVVPPGQTSPVVRMLSFDVAPGQAVGIIGPSGAGKSTLGAALTGVWPVAAGSIRLDGATLDQYDPDTLGGLVGFLPQRVVLFDGTIAENIARMSATPDPDRIIAAARKAAAHDMIVRLPEGYDTRVSQAGGRLSGGQIQRIGLARAFYGDPVLLILDEPNSNLDNDGSVALNHAIRTAKADGCSVLIMAHRPAAIQECDLILYVDGGIRRAFGPRDEVLQAMVRNAQEIAKGGAGGVS